MADLDPLRQPDHLRVLLAVELSDAYLQDYQVRQFRSQSTARGRIAHLVAFFGRDAHAAALSVSNSLSGRHWELDQVPAVGDLTDVVQLGTGHHVSAGEGQRRVALQRRVAAYLVGGGQTPRNVASILDSARELGIRDAQLLWARHFTDIEDLQQALRTFKETYRESEGLCGIPPRARAPQIRRKEWDDA